MNFEDRVTKGYIENAIAAAAGAKIAYGSYTGTGAYGAGNAIRLNTGFAPRFVAVVRSNALYGEHVGFTVWGQTRFVSSGNVTDGHATLTWNYNGVSWYSTNAALYQFNESGSTYNWVAIG